MLIATGGDDNQLSFCQLDLDSLFSGQSIAESIHPQCKPDAHASAIQGMHQARGVRIGKSLIFPARSAIPGLFNPCHCFVGSTLYSLAANKGWTGQAIECTDRSSGLLQYGRPDERRRISSSYCSWYWGTECSCPLVASSCTQEEVGGKVA